MPFYNYEGVKYSGESLTGKIRAKSLIDAKNELKEKNIKILSLIEQEETLANKEIQLFNKVSKKELVPYLRQMTTLIASGVTVLEASMILEKQIKKGKLQVILEEVRKDLENGETLSNAYRKHPNAFPRLLVNVISVAEVSGTLENNLKKLSDYYEKLLENRSTLITAMIYPIMMLLASLGVGIFLMVSIVPMFVDFFESFDAPLPAITVMTMTISDFITSKGIWLFLFLTILIISYIVAKKNPEFRLRVDTLKLKIPVFGEFLQKNDFSVFMTTLSTLLSSSVPMVKALSMSKEVVSNARIRTLIAECEIEIEQGGQLSTIFSASPFVPPLLSQMILIGEKTGSLEDMLQKLSHIFEKEVEENSKRIKMITEPLVMVLIAGMVGFIVASIMLPMFSMYTSIQG
ncbi:type II secretion system F family protein [Enterococcus faecalis]|uniref:type II secretion system F family protein n=1 Tax=Enterococcus faecalis TaxID=1351 RepID=UPI001A097669|nr:type II secretion system F family protein [Enterococcus faecalis]EGO6705176.1 type II secretion system F family protein [Enterococcus faecalis]